MRIAIIGDRKNCGYCRSLTKLVGSATFDNWLKECPACEVVDADKASGALYSQYKAASLKKKIEGRPDSKYPLPVVSVYDGNTLKGSFVARNLTTAKLIAKIEALCPDCSDCADGACDDGAGKTKTCPTCKGKGVVPA